MNTSHTVRCTDERAPETLLGKPQAAQLKILLLSCEVPHVLSVNHACPDCVRTQIKKDPAGVSFRYDNYHSAQYLGENVCAHKTSPIVAFFIRK